MSKITHLMYCPATGLGLYNGFRGNRWLKNRIQIFKQFVIPSLQNQTSKEFVLWCSWRPEEKSNQYVKDLMSYLEGIKEFKTFHSFHGICFYDDKYSDDVARDRLLTSLHDSLGEMTDVVGDVDYVYMTIQPSDDLYHKEFVKNIQLVFEQGDLQAVGFERGYICNYQTKELAEYNPNTNPPFFTIKFKRDVFIDPLKHAEYTGPYKSHEYVMEKLKYGTIKERGFTVGVHGSNISTGWDIPFRGKIFDKEESEIIFRDFGLLNVSKLEMSFSFGKLIFSKLPYSVKRKLRYLAGEKRWILRPFFAIIYKILRN